LPADYLRRRIRITRADRKRQPEKHECHAIGALSAAGRKILNDAEPVIGQRLHVSVK